MALEIGLIVIGIALLLVAGDLLVRGAAGLAIALRVPILLVSLTIVAFGTSAPELFVTVQAVLSGNAGLALGNIMGSNVANVLLILGLPAVIYPISAHVPGLARHGAIMLVATAAFAILAYTRGVIDMRAGAGLLAGIVLYISYTGWRAARGSGEPVVEDVAEYASRSGRAAIFLIAGLVGLPVGAHLLVTNGAALAADLGVREEVIGLTLIAFGTSLPELATVAAAALHKKSDVALGGVVGSNIFNIFAVGGAAGVAGQPQFDPASLRFDIPAMIFAALVVSWFIFLKRDISRLAGVLMCLLYAAFIVCIALKIGQ
ncbi:MAG: calcium/sodium antiporter [Alphaproteobacteria bacterium]|nr:calcium/sodium antiporter [Alphaproteobacteria bacterium]